MDYNLAKELRDAGFPQKDTKEFAYEPCLTELIEACGERFLSVQHVVGCDKHQNYWIATDTENIGSHKHEGKTPEIAVARLWLELNK